MQSIMGKRSQTELRAEAQAARRHLYQQPVSRVDVRRVEVSDYPVTSWSAPEDEKHAKSEVEHDEDHHHWSPNSQSYAPPDLLFQYLRDGWLLGDRVLVQVFQCFSWRCIEVYSFKLTLDGEPVLMPIIANPVILRFVMERGLTVVRVIPDCEISDLL